MNEQMKENLSAFMDGESKDSTVIDAISRDDDARATWSRYHLIRDVLHKRHHAKALGLSERVSAALSNEAVLIAPKQWKQPRFFMKQVAGLALAATVAAVAILVVQNSPTDIQPQDQVAAIAPITKQPIRQTAAIERKLSGYLVSHNEFSASTRMKGVLPYSRIVSPTPGQLVNLNAGGDVE